MCEPVHHSPSMNICIPPGLLSAPHPFLLTDEAQCVLHHVTSELISPRTHKHTNMTDSHQPCQQKEANVQDFRKR